MGTHHATSALLVNDAADWVTAHAALSRLAQERAALDVEEGRWLLCALRSSVHVHLGYGSFLEYIERLFGYKPRTTREKLRVAEALEVLPRVAHALEAGALSWCAARELTRVALPQTEQAWLDAARGKTLRDLEGLVSNKSPGDTPNTPDSEVRLVHVLRFEVAPDTFATFREALQRLRRLSGTGLDDDAVLLAMARHVLGGPGDEGRSSYQVSLSLCSVCGSGAQSAAGEFVPVDATVVEMAACDAQHLGALVPAGDARRAANENAGRDPVPVAAEGSVPNSPAEPAGNAARAARQSSDQAHVGVRSRRADDAATEATPVKPAARANSQTLRRAQQSVPPAMRRAVLARDERRCRVPGCTHATFVDVHHLQPRSEGGRNEASNLIAICSAHHRAIHRGELLIEREGEGALRFRHADGSAYGNAIAPGRIDAHFKVFSALRHLGFREGEVKAVLAELRDDAELRDASVECLLREALRRIRPTAR